MATTALELRHMETLLALAECGSLSKAAERLCLTQSALSHQLKALESHYGAAVVEKSIRPLRFTAIGERLLSLARSVLPLVAEAGRDIARLAEGRYSKKDLDRVVDKKYGLFLYGSDSVGAGLYLQFWNDQRSSPTTALINGPDTAGFGSRIAATTRWMPAAMIALVQGPVRPVVQHGSSVT